MAVAAASVGSATGSNAGTVAVGIPAGLAAGDVMVARVFGRVTTPISWTAGDFTAWATLQTPSQTNASQWVGWKVADATDAGKTQFSSTSGSVAKWTAIVYRVTGSDGAIQDSAVGGSGTAGTAHSIPSVSGTTNGLLIGLIGSPTAGSWTTMTGFTLSVADQTTAGGGSNGSSTAQHKVLSATAATGVISSTGPSGVWVSTSVSVAPAAAAAVIPTLVMAPYQGAF
jgi:hypothetical protein